MNSPALYVTHNDLGQLRHVVAEAHWHNTHAPDDIDRLEAELARRLTVPAEEIPGDVITLNTQVGLVDLETCEAFACTVVLPREADIAQSKISILAPAGLAILGHRVGDTIEWPAPAGVQRMLVTMVLYQPEAVGIYDLAEG
jgi:regulator of nucleoside diphosphate kinase